MVGLRGVGKTVLLDRLREDAEGVGIQTLRVEAPESRSLPAILAPQLRQALLRLSRNEQAKEFAQRALRGLAGFAKSLKVKYQDIEVGLDLEPEPGLADNGDLEHDLQALLEVTGAAAKKAGTALVIFVDELQYVTEDELAALTKPACDLGVRIDEDALDRIIRETRGYPYFLQEWGKHAWDAAETSPITLHDVEQATAAAIAALDESFFRVRFDRLTPLEKRYLRAMAELGAGPHRSGDIAVRLGRDVTSLGPTRSQLIVKGMIWSPSHGDTAFTVPLFDKFMKRIMPGNDWNR